MHHFIPLESVVMHQYFLHKPITVMHHLINKALLGILVKTQLGFGFTAKIETQPKNSVWTLNLTQFLFDKHLVTRLG